MNDVDEIILKIFCAESGIPKENVTDETAYDTTEKWDSLVHLQIVGAIEDRFSLEFDTNDIIAMETFGIMKDIVKKYLAKKG